MPLTLVYAAWRPSVLPAAARAYHANIIPHPRTAVPPFLHSGSASSPVIRSYPAVLLFHSCPLPQPRYKVTRLQGCPYVYPCTRLEL